MDKLFQALRSRTVWTVLVIVLLNSVPQLKEVFPSQAWVDTLNGLLLVAAAYFRVNPSK